VSNSSATISKLDLDLDGSECVSKPQASELLLDGSRLFFDMLKDFG
jgi:hypothetical protein